MQSPEERPLGQLVALALGGALLLAAAPRPVDGSAACSKPYRSSRDGGTEGPITVWCGLDAASGPWLPGPTALLFGGALDANRAPASWLEVLPGIGPERAAAWIRARERHPFCTRQEIARVPGIGPRTLERIGDLVRVAPRAACATAPGERR